MIKISKGLDLPISGNPSTYITDKPKNTSVALLGSDFVGMKPTMNVMTRNQRKKQQIKLLSKVHGKDDMYCFDQGIMSKIKSNFEMLSQA